ncbi:MAG: DUF4010 domain-containing protein [Methylococcaceae bacterium]
MTFYSAIPPLLVQFILTIAFSFVVGLEFRRYLHLAKETDNEKNNNKPHFGSTRTFTLIGVLGFVLNALDNTHVLYAVGLLLLGFLLLLFYWRLTATAHFSLFGNLLALLIYTIGPIASNFPTWFLVAFVVLLILILNEKPLIHRISEQLANEEIVTLAKFLIMSGVILPLLPDEAIAPLLPVTYYKVWLAVIIVSGFSYLSYLVNSYFFKNRSLMITGLLAGLYSSTAATVVISRRAYDSPEQGRQISSALIMATTMMYLRLLVIIFLFDKSAGLLLLLPFVSIIIVSLLVIVGLLTVRNHSTDLHQAASVKHPLELSTAIAFALLFVIFTFITQYITSQFGSHGLNFLAVVVGFTDIDPFILALLSGKFAVENTAIVSAVILASGSNNLLKATYAIALARNKSVLFAAAWLVFLFVLSILYIYYN